MGKKYTGFPNSRYNVINNDVQEEEEDDDEEDEDDDVNSDMEMRDDRDVDEVEEINIVEDLNKHTEKIQKEYAGLLAKKGGKPSWLETLTLTGDVNFDEDLNIDDDIKRELAFYNTTTENVVKGILKLREVRIGFIT
jgi:hypothetical protein